jgi:hypothetical protein
LCDISPLFIPRQVFPIAVTEGSQLEVLQSMFRLLREESAHSRADDILPREILSIAEVSGTVDGRGG